MKDEKKTLLFSDTKTSADTVIRLLHCPDDYAKVPAGGKPRPKDPPTVWPGVLSRGIPRPMPLRRLALLPELLHSCEKRSQINFRSLLIETVTFSASEDDIREERLPNPPDITTFRSDSVMLIQSRSFSNGVQQFLLILNEKMNFEAFYKGSRTHIQILI